MEHHQKHNSIDLDNREESDEPVRDFNQRALSQLKGHQEGVVMGHGTIDNLVFEWMITPWSECSQTCGANGSGFRVISIFYSKKLFNLLIKFQFYSCEQLTAW